MADRADEYYAHALDLLAIFALKHGEIDQNRNVVRQRIQPHEEVKGKRLITVRQARAYALVTAMRSYFARAAEKIKVRPENNSKKEVGYTTEQERWLSGFSHTIASRAGFVYSDAMWHGIESGEMILQASFNPIMARNGVMGLRPRAIDPRSAAYEWTEDGLGCFVIDETERIGVAYKELFGNYTKLGSKAGYTIPAEFQQAYERRPTDTVRITKYYDLENEYLWLDTAHVWTRPHFMGQVPFHIGYFYDMPTDWQHPEERGRGAISPIRDLLVEEETLYDIWATNAEFGQRPMVLYYDQVKAKWILGVSAPGSAYNAPMATPPKEWKGEANFQLLEQLATMLNDQIASNTIPDPAASMRGRISGYALSIMQEPIKLRFDALRPYAELCLGSHYEMLLLAYKKFAKKKMADRLAPQDSQSYLDSFAVSVDVDAKRGKVKQHSWVSLNIDEISQHPYVEVSLKPKLESDKGAQTQQFELAMRSGDIPRTWAWENILDVDDPDDMLRDWKFDWLLKNNPTTQQFVSDLWMKEWVDDNPDIKKELLDWEAAQREQEQGQQGQDGGQPPMSPMDFASQQGQGGQPQDPSLALPTGQGMPSAATMGNANPSVNPQNAMAPQNFMPQQSAPH